MFSKDKLYHFGASFVLALFDPLFAAGCGIGKEVGDWMNYGKLDRSKEYYIGVALDLFADALGIFCAIPFWRLIWSLI